MLQRETIDPPLQKWQQAVWLLIALITPLFVNFWVEQQFEASKIWLFRTLVWALFVLWLAGWLTGLRYKPLSTPVRNVTIALILILLLSTMLSTQHTIAIFGTLDRANGVVTQISYLLLFLCVATQIDSQNSWQLLIVVVLTAVPICLLALVQATGWQPLPVFTDARSPITTTLGRANFTGAYLALLLPLTLAAALSAAQNWWRSSMGLLVVLELVVIALTQARAAWIAACVGIGVFVWLRMSPKWSWRVQWVSAIGGIAVLVAGLLLLLQRGIANGGSIAARWTIWQASLRLLWPRLWLGYGADTLELHFPSVYPPQLVYYQGRGVVVDRAHNWLLDWSLNYGVVATAVFIALIIFILRQGWKYIKGSQNEQILGSRWVAACMASVCAQLVGNLFLFEVAATAVLFWMLLGVITAVTSQTQTRSAQISLLPWVRTSVIAASVIILGWAIWQSNVRPLLADMHSWRGTNALSQGDAVAALVEYETAVTHQPHRSAYHVALALTSAQLGDFVQANRSMHAAITLRPTDPVLYAHLAALHAHESRETPEKITMAYAAYEQALSLAPTIAITYQNYADAALRSGDGELARIQAQHAVDLDATDGIAFGILGWVHLQNGSLVAAHEAFLQAVKWEPESADFHFGLALVNYQQSHFNAARQSLTQSLMRDPTYAPALSLQVQLQDK
ncbi:MAG: hypothetical protein DWQ04_07225 [Chloroflexi bacterium]|nr:MAG: hypothetical protein DWQ04_07225 [Chloroflexota bacterium]